jgi:hypothetical protein
VWRESKGTTTVDAVDSLDMMMRSMVAVLLFVTWSAVEGLQRPTAPASPLRRRTLRRAAAPETTEAAAAASTTSVEGVRRAAAVLGELAGRAAGAVADAVTDRAGPGGGGGGGGVEGEADRAALKVAMKNLFFATSFSVAREARLSVASSSCRQHLLTLGPCVATPS